MEVIGHLNHQTLYPQELMNRKMDKGHRQSWLWKRTSLKEKYLSLDVDSSPAARTSRRQVPTKKGGTLDAMLCMRHNPPNTALGVLTYVIVVKAHLRENEKKKFLKNEDQAVPYEKPQKIPVVMRSKA